MTRITSMLVALALVAVLAQVGAAGEQQKTHKEKSKNQAAAGKPLFNGKNLAGWEFYLTDPKAKMEDVWSVKNGMLVCQGDPQGYLCSKEKFTNFKLTLEWRWAPDGEPGNSGVLVRVTGEPKMLPKCMEAQLQSGKAGDLYGFHGYKMDGDPERKKVVAGHELGGDLIGVTRKVSNEKEPGQWNKYRIRVQDGNIVLRINGKKVNQAHDCDIVAGAIALQSEGGEIHFRNIKIVTLD